MIGRIGSLGARLGTGRARLAPALVPLLAHRDRGGDFCNQRSDRSVPSRRRLFAAFALALALHPAVALAVRGVSTQAIEEGLTCQCGCGLTVHSCNHVSCGSAVPLRRAVRGFVEEGLGLDDILLRFQDRYGEKILSAPTTEGFNLMAWVLPFVLLGTGSLVVLVTIRRWSSEAADVHGPLPSLSDDDRKRVERALREKDL